MWIGERMFQQAERDIGHTQGDNFNEILFAWPLLSFPHSGVQLLRLWRTYTLATSLHLLFGGKLNN
jgi:hypothetical protein